MFEAPIILESEYIRLRPIRLEDATAFSTIADDPSIWSFFTSDLVARKNMQEWVAEAVNMLNSETRYPFTIEDKSSGEIIGSTSFGNISFRDRRLEIGWTWLGKASQGKGINKQGKFLLLRYAFETLQFERVEFKTDVLNQQARKALLKIGATEEGILRSHTQMPHNRRRDTIFYSVLASEWEEVKKRMKSEG